jgi:hypothetical protein
MANLKLYLLRRVIKKGWYLVNQEGQPIDKTTLEVIAEPQFISTKANAEMELARANSLGTYKKVEEAKEFLESRGFQTKNLWCVNDVKDKYKCDDETALDILYEALTNDATMEQIWLAIDDAAENEDLELIEE